MSINTLCPVNCDDDIIYGSLRVTELCNSQTKSEDSDTLSPDDLERGGSPLSP